MQRIRERIYYFWEERPLQFLLVLGLSLRILAALFSRGYGWHDDHFLTIEPPHSWVHGFDYNHWLPSSNNGEFKPSGHSFTYAGIMYGIFYLMEGMGLTDPQWQMTLIRFLHAVFSLLVIVYGFRISRQLFGMPAARTTGLLLAALYFMPFLSVRNLVEMVCIPFLMGGTWFLLRKDGSSWKWLMLSALFFGMAFSIRYQTLFFAAGTGLIMLFTFPFVRTLAWGACFAMVVGLTQGLTDYLIWGVPFAEFTEYVLYNQAAAADYFVREWYMYLVLLAGVFIPPFSLFILAGFVRGFRKSLLISLPVLLFLAFHSWFPNKQERFILPILPFLLILGYGAWQEFLQQKNSHAWKRFNAGAMKFFWALNLLALVPLTFMYSKKSRVEAMSWLGAQPDYVAYIIEDSNNSRITMLPDFYSGKAYSSWRIMADIPASWTHEHVARIPAETRPNYMLFMYEDKLEERIKAASQLFHLEPMTRIEPGYMDRFLHWLNPYNRNEAITICRIRWEDGR